MLLGYFDESERESGVFCVAGFLFAPEQLKKFLKEWARLFAEFEGGLHMRHFAHRIEAFEGITKPQQAELMAGAAEIITQRMSMGVAVSCNVDEVDSVAPKWIRGFGHAYSICCHIAMIATGNFVEKSGSSENVIYAFEAGHPRAAEARDFMRSVVKNPDVKSRYRHAADSFLPKNEAVALQAADMLAYEWAKFRDETLERGIRPPRKSLIALLGRNIKRYSGAHIEGKPLRKYMRQIEELGLLQVREEAEHGRA